MPWHTPIGWGRADAGSAASPRSQRSCMAALRSVSTAALSCFRRLCSLVYAAATSSLPCIHPSMHSTRWACHAYEWKTRQRKKSSYDRPIPPTLQHAET